MNRNMAGTDLFASPAIDAQRCLLKRIYIRNLFFACSQCQKSHGSQENLGLFFVSRADSHAAEALNAVVQSHEPVDHTHGDSTEAFAFASSAALSTDSRKTLRDALVDVPSVNDEVLDHRKVLKRLQSEIPGHRDCAGKTGFTVDHYGTLPAVAPLTVEAKGKAWIEMLINIE